MDVHPCEDLDQEFPDMTKEEESQIVKMLGGIKYTGFLRSHKKDLSQLIADKNTGIVSHGDLNVQGDIRVNNPSSSGHYSDDLRQFIIDTVVQQLAGAPLIGSKSNYPTTPQASSLVHHAGENDSNGATAALPTASPPPPPPRNVSVRDEVIVNITQTSASSVMTADTQSGVGPLQVPVRHLSPQIITSTVRGQLGYERISGHILRPNYLKTVFTGINEIAYSDFGTILLAINKFDRLSYALKVIPSVREHFKFEQHAQLAHKLMGAGAQDPRAHFVVQTVDCWYEEVLDNDEQEDQYPFDIFSEEPITAFFFIQMEFCPEGPLSSWLNRRRVTEKDDSTAWRLLWDLLQGLDFLHDKGIVHGNLNPDNILLFRDNGGELRAKIGGFIFGPDYRALESYSEGFNTKYYTSPEVGRSPDAATMDSDVFSLGVVFFAMNICMVNGDGSMNKDHFRTMEDRTVQNYPSDIQLNWRKCMASMTAKKSDERPTVKQVIQFMKSGGVVWKNEPVGKKLERGAKIFGNNRRAQFTREASSVS